MRDIRRFVHHLNADDPTFGRNDIAFSLLHIEKCVDGNICVQNPPHRVFAISRLNLKPSGPIAVHEG